MSLFSSAIAVCGQCGEQKDVELAASVNAARRPELRDAILDGTFQAELCPKCGTQMRLPANLTYIDMTHHQWIIVEDIAARDDWRTSEIHAAELYDKSFGANAPAAARGLGDELTARLVFGWPALREKIHARALGLDDVTLELLKIAMIRSIANPPLAAETELRLTAGDAETLTFTWFEPRAERALSTVEIGRDVYDSIAAAPGAWAALHADLDGNLFVDVNRLIFA